MKVWFIVIIIISLQQYGPCVGLTLLQQGKSYARNEDTVMLMIMMFDLDINSGLLILILRHVAIGCKRSML